jgi:hypothetical protein
MMRGYVRIAFVVSLTTFIYLALASFLVGYSFAIAPGLELMQDIFGRLGGARIWAHSVQALALAVSAIPSAAILSLAMRPRAVAFAAVTGLTAAVVALADTLFRADILPLLDITDFVHMGLDFIKTVVILMLLTWLLTKVSSNQRTQRFPRAARPAQRGR